ncbi:TBCC domain-containing protein 1 [Phytophthora cinnamomi]|uniref:TBCC domain-containing protein 1 n=1 Tax=Phytophthora cinnamomi TaxID=4785 RepID=UPI00355A1139|nr:TBCC domain-containing protein 1 [Phytophthora cinnamomi]
MVMVLALVRTAAKQASRGVGRVPQLQTVQGARSFAFRTRRSDDDDESFRGRRRRNPEDFEPKDADEETGDLYDPYREYMETTGERGYREFNPDNVDSQAFHREWEEPAAMMEDKSWPATTGTDLFTDLLNIPSEPPSGEKLDKILKEAFARMGHTGNINDVQLPEMDVQIPADHPDREALEIMKLSMMNNGRLKMDDKNDLLKSIIDELNHLRNDKTTLFKGLDNQDEDKSKKKSKKN